MKFHEFMQVMVKQTYVWQMARGTAYSQRPSLAASGQTRMVRAQRRIDDAVLARSLTIADERRCSALIELDNPKGSLVTARCEFQKGHGPVGPGMADSRISHVTVTRDWDHGAPSAGKWWMDEMTTQMETPA